MGRALSQTQGNRAHMMAGSAPRPLPAADPPPVCCHPAQLDLSGNAFDGALPATWATKGVWPSLQILDLSDNSLDVRLPHRCCP